MSSAANLSRLTASRVASSLADDVRAGLTGAKKQLHPKYFYDERGSKLFDQICDTPEYYLTRTEQALLDKHAEAIIEQVAPQHIVEFGSGMSRKTRVLLNAWEGAAGPKTYWPLDVDQETLAGVVAELEEEYLTIKTHGLIGDYTAGLEHLPNHEGRLLGMFLGSTLGNFDRDSGPAFIAELSDLLQTDDYFLLGVDLHKDPEQLTAAYNDAEGFTAEFNLNVLRVLNRQLGADFDLRQFRHRAIYNDAEKRIEMYLDSLVAQQVSIKELDLIVDFAKDEPVLTEISRKFTRDDIEWLFEASGLQLVRSYVDVRTPYALALGQKTAI